MYSLLQDTDVLEGLYQNMIKCENTKKALSLEHLGYFKHASRMYVGLLNCERNVKKDNQSNFYNIDSEFNNIHLTK